MTLASRTRISLLALTLACIAPNVVAQAPAPPRPVTSTDSRTWHLTYTLTESDGSKLIGVQHYSMTVLAGSKSVLKQGSKVPIATGSTREGTETQTKFTYIDIGINIDATIEDLGTADRVSLHTKVEQSSIAEAKSIVGVSEPVIRQTYVDVTSMITSGKSIAVGSLDVPGSTRHLEVAVLIEPVR
jgi:hypothetical protein